MNWDISKKKILVVGYPTIVDLLDRYLDIPKKIFWYRSTKMFSAYSCTLTPGWSKMPDNGTCDTGPQKCWCVFWGQPRKLGTSGWPRKKNGYLFTVAKENHIIW